LSWLNAIPAQKPRLSKFLWRVPQLQFVSSNETIVTCCRACSKQLAISIRYLFMSPSKPWEIPRKKSNRIDKNELQAPALAISLPISLSSAHCRNVGTTTDNDALCALSAPAPFPPGGHPIYTYIPSSPGPTNMPVLALESGRDSAPLANGSSSPRSALTRVRFLGRPLLTLPSLTRAVLRP
jgi:hypothetical protein